MPIIEMPDGRKIEFPNSMGEKEINLVLAQEEKGKAPQASPAPQSDRLSWSDVPGKALSNIPGSALEFGKAMVQPVIHPVDTGKALYGVASGGVQKLIPGEQGNEAKFNALVDLLKQRYGGVDELKNTIATDPVGFLSDIATAGTGAGAAIRGVGMAGKVGSLANAGKAVMSAGKAVEPLSMAGKAAAPLARQAGEVGSSLWGAFTGAGKEPIKQAFRGGEDFTSAMRGKIEGTDILNKSKEALQTLRDDRARDYTQRLAKISQNQDTIDISPVKQKMLSLMDEFNVKVHPNKKALFDAGATQDALDFSRSTLDRNAIADIQGIIEKVQDWGSQPGDLTPLGLDILKRQLDDFYAPSRNSRAFVSSLRNTVKDTLVSKVPEYSEMTKNYELATRFLQDTEKSLSQGGKAAIETQVRKLQQALREANPTRMQTVKKVDELAGSNLQAMIAGSAMNPWAPGGLTGRVIGYGSIPLAFSNPTYLAIPALASPRISGEMLNQLGKIYRTGQGATGLMSPPVNMGLFQSGRLAEER